MIDTHHSPVPGGSGLPQPPRQITGAHSGAEAGAKGCDRPPLAVRELVLTSGYPAGLSDAIPEDAEAPGELAAGIGEVEARFVDPAGNEQRKPWADAARGVCLEECGLVRRFPVRHGKRMAPGWWWSATDGRLVHYASGVMRTQVMLLDHDPHVVAIACRPVELTWREREGVWVRHAPHLMARLTDGRGLLADCAGDTVTSRRAWPPARR